MTKERFWHRTSMGLLIAWVALLPIQTRFFLRQAYLGGEVWEYGSLSIYATDILLVMALIASVIALRDRFWRKPKQLSGALLASVLGVLLAAFVSIIQAYDTGLALAAWVRLLFGAAAWWLIIRNGMRLGVLAWAVVVSATVEAIVALSQFLMQAVSASTVFGLAAHTPDAPGAFVIESVLGRFLRAYGTLPHPNMAAAWLVVGLALSVGLYLRLRDRLERAVVLAAFAIMTAGLFVTFSRSALVAWLLILLGFVIVVLFGELREYHWHGSMGFRRHDLPVGLKMMKLVTTSILLVGMLLLIFEPLVAARTAATGRLEVQSISTRVEQLADAQALIGKNWLFGVGIGNYTKALHKAVDSSRKGWDYQPVHNVPLLTVTELGLFGGLLLLALVLQIVAHGYAGIRRRWRGISERPFPWVSIASAAIVALFVIGLVDHFLWSLEFGVMLGWLVFGAWVQSLTAEEDT